MNLYKSFLRPLLFLLPPETSHHFVLSFLRYPAATRWLRPWTHSAATQRPVTLWGLEFPNPIGVAAGLDKDAVALPAWENLGFGFIEIGGITPGPQRGKPRPRIFRLPAQKALINHMDFPNSGTGAVAARLKALQESGNWPRIPVGINITKSSDTPLEKAAADFVTVLEALRDYGDFFVVNVSCPNTASLRELQGKTSLGAILQCLIDSNQASVRPRPLLVKIAPDLDEAGIDDILEAVTAHRIDGIVATNTTLDKTGMPLQKKGGLSGMPLRARSTEVIRYIHRRTEGKLPIIGVGGIFTAADAQEKLDAGASLVQTYIGFIYEGPMMVRRICEGLRR